LLAGEGVWEARNPAEQGAHSPASGRWLRRSRRRGRSGLARVAAGALVFVLGAGFIAAWTCWETRQVRLRSVEVPLPGLPRELDGLRILHLSDLHGRWVGRSHRRLFAALSGTRFDLVAVTGDLLDMHAGGMLPAIALIEGLVPRAPTYVVPGNHDRSRPEFRELMDALVALGAKVLINRGEELRVGPARIWVAGLDDATLGLDDLEAALRGRQARWCLLLSHCPAIFPQAAAMGVQLVLAGHTHGGQVRLPLVGAVWLPPGSGGFEGGLYCRDGHWLHVTVGLGTTLIPVRLLCRPELVLLVLRRQEPDR